MSEALQELSCLWKVLGDRSDVAALQAVKAAKRDGLSIREEIIGCVIVADQNRIVWGMMFNPIAHLVKFPVDWKYFLAFFAVISNVDLKVLN